MIILVLTSCSGAAEQSADDPPPLVQQGEELYEANCTSCHGGDSGGVISDRPPRHNANGHTWHHPDCLLTDITMRGAAAWGADPSSSDMPAFEGELSEMEVEAILAYIKTWWTDEQRTFQAEITETNCDG